MVGCDKGGGGTAVRIPSKYSCGLFSRVANLPRLGSMGFHGSSLRQVTPHGHVPNPNRDTL